MLGGPGPGAGALGLHSSAAASSASPAPARRGAERSAAGLPRAPQGWLGSETSFRAAGGSRRRLAPSPSSPPAALSSGFFCYILSFFFFPLPGSRQASPSMPIAHLLELWKGIEVEPMETEVSRGAAGTPTLPSEPPEHCAPPSAPGSETSLVPQTRRGPGDVGAAPRRGDGHGVRVAACLCRGRKPRGLGFVVKRQPAWPLT